MKAIILPIKPRFVKKIFTGEKHYEFRKKLCKEGIQKIIIYETAPVKRVVGEVDVIKTVCGLKNSVWEKCKEFAGITEEEYNNYFKDCSKACAYEIDNPRHYNIPKQKEEYGVYYQIQSFAYIDIEDENAPT